MQPRVRRRILIISVTIAVVLAVVYGFMPKPVPVDIVPVNRAAMRVTVDEEGKTRVKDRFVVSASVSGYLRRVELEVGDSIAKGQIIAELEQVGRGAYTGAVTARPISALPGNVVSMLSTWRTN